MCKQSPFARNCDSLKHDQVGKSQHGHQKQVVKQSSKEDASSSSAGSIVRDNVSKVEGYHGDTSVGQYRSEGLFSERSGEGGGVSYTLFGQIIISVAL